MDLKTIILVIILALFLGVAILFGISFVKGSPVSMIGTTFAGINEKVTPSIEPTPTPRPTLAPLSENANLEEEIKNLKTPDFSEDYQNLRNQIN